MPLVARPQGRVVKHLTEQDRKALHFGFTLGLNTMDFRIQPSEYAVENNFFPEVSVLSPGFNINIVSNFRLTNSFDLRILPGVSFGQRRIDFYNTLESGLPGSTGWNEGYEPVLENSQQLESSFLELPVIIKYKSVRINNYRPYIIGGVNLRYDLAKNFNEDDQIYLDLDPFNVYAEGGFGIDFYLPFFKFSAELKYSNGLFDMLNERISSQTSYQDAIGQLKSSMVILSFHFE